MKELANYSFDDDGILRKFGSLNRYNRVLYGGHGRDAEDYGKFFTFAGDAPIFMGAASDCLKNNWCYQAKRGVLQSGLALTPGVTFGNPDRYGKWFHNSRDIVSSWQHGFMEYSLSQFSAYFPETEIKIEVYPLQKHDGFLVHYNIIADAETVFCAVLGGMTDYIGRFDPPDSTVRDLRLQDCQTARAEVAGKYGRLFHTESNSSIIAGCSFDAEILTDAAECAVENSPTVALTAHEGEAAVLKFVKRLAPGERLCGNLLVLCNADEPTLQYYLDNDPRSEIVQAIRQKSSGIKITTPDLRLNATVVDQQIALDAAYHTPTFFHGAIGYHAPFLGWRGWYGGTLAGWYERVRSAARAHLATKRPKNSNEKIWYDGSDRPDLDHEGTQYHHWENAQSKLTAMLYKEDIYNMQEVFIDMLLHYIDCSGDWDLGREVFDDLDELLAAEERIFDADGDGLYQSFLNTWISDGHSYNGGGCTQASCYNYAANCKMALLARKLNRDGSVFENRARKIRDAVNRRLWQEDTGVFAEFIDTVGNKLLHPAPELSTIYLASESELATPEQMTRSLQYTEKYIRSTLTCGRRGRLAYSSAWLPKKYSTCGLFPAENAALALAYFRSYRKTEALQLLDGLLDLFALSQTPGGISHVATAQGGFDHGDWDFTDVSSPYLRLLVEGLWGVNCRCLSDEITIAPQLPESWEQAELELPEIKLQYKRSGKSCTLLLTTLLPYTKKIILPGKIKLENIGNAVIHQSSYGTAELTIVQWESTGTLEITYQDLNPVAAKPHLLTGIPERKPSPAVPEKFANLDLSRLFNANLAKIFQQKYLAPRPDTYSIGNRINGRYAWEWNHHGHNAVNLDDTALRQAPGGVYQLPGSIWSFPTPPEGNNAACASIWENFPTLLEYPLHGQAQELVLFMFGATNAMQSFVVNARVIVNYSDGSNSVCELIEPENFDDLLVPAVQQKFERFYWNNGNHGNVVRIKLDPAKTLANFQLEAVANEVIAGILGAALIR